MHARSPAPARSTNPCVVHSSVGATWQPPPFPRIPGPAALARSGGEHRSRVGGAPWPRRKRRPSSPGLRWEGKQFKRTPPFAPPPWLQTSVPIPQAAASPDSLLSIHRVRQRGLAPPRLVGGGGETARGRKRLLGVRMLGTGARSHVGLARRVRLATAAAHSRAWGQAGPGRVVCGAAPLRVSRRRRRHPLLLLVAPSVCFFLQCDGKSSEAGSAAAGLVVSRWRQSESRGPAWWRGGGRQQ